MLWFGFGYVSGVVLQQAPSRDIVKTQPRLSRPSLVRYERRYQAPRAIAVRDPQFGGPERNQKTPLRNLFSRYRDFQDGKMMNAYTKSIATFIDTSYRCDFEGPLAFFYAFLMDDALLMDRLTRICNVEEDLRAIMTTIKAKLDSIDISQFNDSPSHFSRYIAQNGLIELIPLFDAFRHGFDDVDMTHAMESGHWDFVKALFEQSEYADIVPDYHQGYPLDLAIRQNRPDMVDYLLGQGANPNSRNGDYMLQLIQTRISDFEDQVRSYRMMESLLKAGADPNSPNGFPVIRAIIFGRIDLLQLLIRHGVKLDSHGGRALNEAVVRGDDEIINLLIQAGFDVHMPFATSPFASAAVSGRFQMVDYLIQLGLDINMNSGQALWASIADPTAVRYLLQRGASREIGIGPTVIEAIEKGYWESIRVLNDYGVDFEPVLRTIALRCTPNLITPLMKLQPSLNLDEIVLEASKMCDSNLLEELMKLGADLKVQDGKALLNAVVTNTNPDVLQFLLTFGKFERIQVERAFLVSMRNPAKPEYNKIINEYYWRAAEDTEDPNN